MVTIKDIALALGISHSTVSRALNNSDRVQSKTRDMILAKAKEMNYIPNAAARDMKKSQLPIIGVIALNMGRSSYGSEMLGSISQQAKKNGYQLIFIHIEDTSPSETDFNLLREKRVSGLLYISLDPCSIDHHPIFDEIKTVFVNCNCADSNRYTAVRANNEKGLYDIASVVFKQPGFRRSMFINFDEHYSAAVERKQGYIKALNDNNITFFADDYITVPISYDFDFSTLDCDIQRAIECGVNVIFCGRDEIALEVYFTLHRLGFTIPDDVSVIGFDNQSIISQRVCPKLTTVELPYEKMAITGFNMIIYDEQSPVENIIINCDSIMRDSLRKDI